MTPTYGLQFGTLDWSPDGQGGPTRVRVYGLRRGTAAPVVSVVETLLQDGSLERVERHDNRDLTVLLCVDGGTPQQLSEYESALFRECQKERNELRWTPPDGDSATGVFDVLWAMPEFLDEDAWDLREIILGRRNYTVTFRALPFARSVQPFRLTGTISATNAVTATIDDGTSAAAWAGSQGSVVTSTGGQLKMPIAFRERPDISQGTWTSGHERAVRTSAAVDMSGTLYLDVEWRAESSPGAYAFNLSAWADDVALTRVATGPGSTPGSARSTFLCPDTSVTRFAFAAGGQVDGSTAMPTGTLTLDNLRRTNQAPVVGSKRQKVSILDVPGSARTPASLTIAHATSALGDPVLAYTSRSLGAYSPPLSPYAAAAGTIDAARVSGSRFTNNNVTFDPPAALLPAGTYQLVALVASTSNSGGQAATFSPTAFTRINGANINPGQAKSVVATMIGFTTYQLITLGTFVLPPTDVAAGSAAAVRINVGNPPGTIVDEAWLFHMPDDGSASLSIVPCGTAAPAAGGTSNRLFLDAATPTRPYPGAFVGTQPDRSDARAADGAAAIWEEHQFRPGPNLVFTVTPNALDATVTLDGWARWLTHPAE